MLENMPSGMAGHETTQLCRSMPLLLVWFMLMPLLLVLLPLGTSKPCDKTTIGATISSLDSDGGGGELPVAPASAVGEEMAATGASGDVCSSASSAVQTRKLGVCASRSSISTLDPVDAVDAVSKLSSRAMIQRRVDVGVSLGGDCVWWRGACRSMMMMTIGG